MTKYILFLLLTVATLLLTEKALANPASDMDGVPSLSALESTEQRCYCPVPNMTLELPGKNNPGCEAKMPAFKGSTCYFDGFDKPCQISEYTQPERTVKCGGILNECDEEINPSPDWCMKANHTEVKYRAPKAGCGSTPVTEAEFTFDEAVEYCKNKAEIDELLEFSCAIKEATVRAEIRNTEIVYVGCQDVICNPGQNPEEVCSQADCGLAVRCKDTGVEKVIQMESCKVKTIAVPSPSATASITPVPAPTAVAAETPEPAAPTSSPTVIDSTLSSSLVADPEPEVSAAPSATAVVTPFANFVAESTITPVATVIPSPAYGM